MVSLSVFRVVFVVVAILVLDASYAEPQVCCIVDEWSFLSEGTTPDYVDL